VPPTSTNRRNWAHPSSPRIHADSSPTRSGATQRSGATYETPADFTPYMLGNKGSGSGYITITSSVPPPPDGTRVTLADRANMPKLVVKKGSSFFEALHGAHHYRLSGLWVTNKQGGTTTLLLGNNGEDIAHQDPRDPQVDWPHDIIIDHCFFNPVEWDMYPEANLCSSVNTAVGIVGINVTIRDNVMKGFGARYGSSTGANLPGCGTVPLDGESVIIGTAPGPMLIDNNQMEEWFVAFFIGGGDPGSMYGGTVADSPLPTLTSATLSNVNGLKVGDNIAFEMNVASPFNSGITVGAGTITSINGNSVTFTRLVGKWGTNDNYIKIPDGASRPKTVADPGGVAPCSPNYLGKLSWCSRAYWGGFVPSNITITHNYINKPKRWYDYVGTDGKGFFEIKLCDTCLIDGNIFDGRAGFTVTVRNQGGRAPWSVIKNLTLSNNLATQFSAGMYSLFFDNEQLSMESSNIVFDNNLMYGEYNNSSQSGFRPKLFAGTYGDNVRFTHNTVLQSGRIVTYGNSVDMAGIDELTNFVFKDNIVNWGTGTEIGYACFDGGTLSVCTPNFIWTKNAMIGAPTGPIYEEQTLATFPAGNWNPATIADVGFTNPGAGNYKLLSTSPYYRKASDGKDVGVDMDQLLAHLNGPIPIPTPTPTPTATPTPSSTPTPSPTPTPSSTPTPSPTPAPSPTPQASPGPAIPAGSSVSIVSRANVREAPNSTSTIKFIAEVGWKGTTGQCQQDVASTNVYCFVTFDNGNNGYVATQFLKVEAAPQPSPSPSPSPSPVATPTPTPTPATITVSVTSPANNSTFGVDATVTINATATPKSGVTVASVTFMANSGSIGTDTGAPYSISWSGMAAGIYQVTAVAKDSQGLTVTSSPIQVKISKALKSVRTTRRNATTLESALTSSGGSSVGDQALSAADFDTLISDIQQAYLDFNAERAMFSSAKGLEDYLFASLFLIRSGASLSKLPSQNDAITDRMNKLDAYLSFCDDLMTNGAISQASINEANQVNAKVGLTMTQPNTVAPTGDLLMQDGVGMILGSSSTPFTNLIMSAPNNGHSFELGNVSVTIKGQAAEVLSVSPSNITFKVPSDLTGGLADVIVTSRGGFISFSTANVFGLNPTIFMNSENTGAGVLLNGLNVQSGTFSTTSPGQLIGLDTRTRISFFATGVSSALVNTDLGNDVLLANGQRLPNLAESVKVEARTSSGATVMLPVEYAGPQGVLSGLDQITVMLPPQLSGAGNVQLTVIVGSARSNQVNIVVQ